MKDWSDAELKLIKALSPHWHKLVTSDVYFCPPTVYKVLVEDAFNNNSHGPAVEALRRCSNAIHKCNPYRMTPEFDELAKYE